jgi:hypothetical protein
MHLLLAFRHGSCPHETGYRTLNKLYISFLSSAPIVLLILRCPPASNGWWGHEAEPREPGHYNGTCLISC